MNGAAGGLGKTPPGGDRTNRALRLASAGRTWLVSCALILPSKQNCQPRRARSSTVVTRVRPLRRPGRLRIENWMICSHRRDGFEVLDA